MNELRRESSDGRNFSIRVIKFSREECPFSNRDHNWQQFNTFRNAVLDILLSYGTVGPTGKMRILETYEESVHEGYDGQPDFFVVDDDMYGLIAPTQPALTVRERSVDRILRESAWDNTVARLRYKREATEQKRARERKAKWVR